MAIADVGLGAQVGLKDLLLQRMAAQQYADHLKQQDFENQRQLAGDARAQQQLEETSALRRATEADAAKQKTYAEADKMAEQYQPGTEFMPSSPAVATMQAGGRGEGLQPRMTLPSRQMTGGGMTPDATGSFPDAQPAQGFIRTTTRTEAKPELYIKTATAKQADTLADNARQLAALNKPLKPTAEEDASRYMQIQTRRGLQQPTTPEDDAWAKAYEHTKTLGTDTSAAAANQRQAQTELFQRQQAGRAELSNKVEQPYNDATEKADTLRAVVHAAQGGNMIAGSVQPLLATLGITTMEGVKRINSTELNQVQGAGSLLDRIRGAAGRLTEGQPMDPALQKDLVSLADMLQASAHQKYLRGHKAVTQRYQLTDETPMGGPSEAPAAPPAAAPMASHGATAGQPITVPFGGKSYTFPTPAAADGFKREMGIQ